MQTRKTVADIINSYFEYMMQHEIQHKKEKPSKHQAFKERETGLEKFKGKKHCKIKEV